MSDPFTALSEALSEPDKEPVGEDTVAGSGPSFSDPLGMAKKRERKSRPAGEPKSRPASRGKTDVKAIATRLVGIHALLATVSGQDVLKLDDDEGTMLAKAISDILEEYQLVADSKSMLWINLISAVAIIYIPRIIVIRLSAASKPKVTKQPKPTAQPQPARTSGVPYRLDWTM